ncbi:MAG: hypothetical protein ACRCYU_06360 [Nocardioides sp.]
MAGNALKVRRDQMAGFDGPVFPDSRGGSRDRSNTGKAFRAVRDGHRVRLGEVPHLPQAVATILDQSGATAREVADQLGRVSMARSAYLARRATSEGNAAALAAHDSHAGRTRRTTNGRIGMGGRAHDSLPR